jgi:hypothetical protein
LARRRARNGRRRLNDAFEALRQAQCEQKNAAQKRRDHEEGDAKL